MGEAWKEADAFYKALGLKWSIAVQIFMGTGSRSDPFGGSGHWGIFAVHKRKRFCYNGRNEKGGHRMDTRCRYCGKETDDGATFCSEKCAAQYGAATGNAFSRVKRFLLGAALSLLVILWGPVSGTEQMVGIGVALLGFVIAKWPLTFSETVQVIGYVSSYEICRAVGVTIIPMGLVTTFFV